MLEHRPAVIFTTAYSDHALKGFDYGAIDYLHKPIRFERFIKAMEKAEKWCSVQPAPVAAYLELKTDGRNIALKIADICYVESLGNYIKVHMPDTAVMVLMTMNEIENRLPGHLFVRLHKSYIVNAAKISRRGAEQVTVNGMVLPVGKTYKKYFSEFLKMMDSHRE